MFVENIMKVIIILLLTIKKALFELNSTNNINKRLIGDGTEYDASKYPYVVFLLMETEFKSSTCTGILLHKLYVLTAAHCVYGKDKNIIKIYQGSMINNTDFRRLIEIHMHKDYDPEENVIQGDVSVLKIERSFPNVKKYIRIGGKPKDFANNKALKCVEIGFGCQDEKCDIDNKGYMITTNVRYGRTACKGYENIFISTVWQQLLCSEPTTAKFLKSTCPGDSGGPMICNNLLYGISSFHYNYNGSEELQCGVPNMQTTHVFLNYFKKWILDKMKGIEDENEEKKKEEDKDEKEKKEEDKEKKKKEKKKKKRKKKSSGNSIKPHNIFHKVLTILLYCMLTKI